MMVPTMLERTSHGRPPFPFRAEPMGVCEAERRDRESFASGKRDAEGGRERREEPENGPSCVLIVVRVERERGQIAISFLFL